MILFFEDDVKFISQLLTGIENKEKMELILKDLLTPQEIMDISERIKILKMLKKKKTQRQISEELGISVTTVNRGSRVLKFGSGEIESIL